MRLKLSGVQNDEELKAAVAAGADAVGFYVGQQLPGANFILPSTAARLAEQLTPLVTPVLITQFENADEIAAMADRSGIYTVQMPVIGSEEIAKLREKLPRSAKILLEIGNDAFAPGFVMAFIGEFIGLINAAVIRCSAPERVGELADIVGTLPLPVIFKGGEEFADAAAAAGVYALDREIAAPLQ